jgi:hypothetical protein
MRIEVRIVLLDTDRGCDAITASGWDESELENFGEGRYVLTLHGVSRCG